MRSLLVPTVVLLILFRPFSVVVVPPSSRPIQCLYGTDLTFMMAAPLPERDWEQPYCLLNKAAGTERRRLWSPAKSSPTRSGRVVTMDVTAFRNLIIELGVRRGTCPVLSESGALIMGRDAPVGVCDGRFTNSRGGRCVGLPWGYLESGME